MLSAQSILWHVIDRSWTSTFIAPIALALLAYAARVPHRLLPGVW
jgi:hypothetical protein